MISIILVFLYCFGIGASYGFFASDKEIQAVKISDGTLLFISFFWPVFIPIYFGIVWQEKMHEKKDEE